MSHAELSTRAAIRETAAQVLAERDASMAELASAAGVSRATLYRYYPTREELLSSLAAHALAELADRVAAAGLEQAPMPQAVERLARAFLAVGDRYTVLVRERAKPDPHEAERRLRAPLRALFEQGVAEGQLRADVSAAVHLQLFTSLVSGALQGSLQRELGVEPAAALISSVFLDGARRPDDGPLPGAAD